MLAITQTAGDDGGDGRLEYAPARGVGSDEPGADQQDVTLAAAERETLEFLNRWVDAGASPMCGNSICQDRRFLARQMPALEAYFHYRNLDVSTLKILAMQWAPEVASGFVKESTHRALADIRDSIAELAWYRDHLLDQTALRRAGT